MAEINQRSISDLIREVAAHIQEILRSEFLLAKVELKQETQKAVPAVTRLVVGLGLGIFAFGFFLLTCMFLLWLVLPWWLGALILGVLLAPIALILINSGIVGLRRLNPTPERTLRTVKENVQWAKEQMP